MTGNWQVWYMVGFNLLKPQSLPTWHSGSVCDR